MMSSNSKKKVHYTPSTKGKSSHSHTKGHSHKSSRDSGLGSSSASDRASLGTPNDSPFNSQDTQYQRHNPSALSEALDAANDTIRELQESNEQLKQLLKDSNREKRSLREEKNDLIKEVEHLGAELDDETRAHDKLRRELGGSKKSSASPRRTTPPSHRRREDDRSSHGSSSSYHDDSGRRYIVPQAPTNTSAPNPFIPLHERAAPPPAVTYGQPTTTVSYSPVTYAPAPAFASRPAGSRTSGSSYQTPQDGNYHSYPV